MPFKNSDLRPSVWATLGLLILALMLIGCSSDNDADKKTYHVNSGAETTTTTAPTVTYYTAANVTAGEAKYTPAYNGTATGGCTGAGCHNTLGNTDNAATALQNCTKCSTFDDLKTKIEDEMPTVNPGLCIGDCATDTAAYILETFN